MAKLYLAYMISINGGPALLHSEIYTLRTCSGYQSLVDGIIGAATRLPEFRLVGTPRARCETPV